MLRLQFHFLDLERINVFVDTIQAYQVPTSMEFHFSSAVKTPDANEMRQLITYNISVPEGNPLGSEMVVAI